MSHDVDWSRSGPTIEHIIARRERFDESIVRRTKEEKFNPYFGIPQIEEIEKEFQIRSTFFFRPGYDDGRTVEEYASVIKELLRGKWEIGLHINDSSSIDSILNEKQAIENLTGSPIIGSRAHYLRITADQMKFLRSAGLLYDSSMNFEKAKFDLRNTGYIVEQDGLIVFPITFMDAYLFTYSKLGEDSVINFIMSGLSAASASGKEFATILWHDNSVLMKGGRVYRALVEKIVQREDMQIIRGADAYEIAKRRLAN